MHYTARDLRLLEAKRKEREAQEAEAQNKK